MPNNNNLSAIDSGENHLQRKVKYLADQQEPKLYCE